jgi:AraC-like DNA-binding protein
VKLSYYRMTTLALKNMVCASCIRVVREELEQLGHPVHQVVLGAATLSAELSPAERARIAEVMTANGFELLTDRDQQLVEEIKSLIIRQVHHGADKLPHLTFSAYLEKKLRVNYGQLSRLFSGCVGMTIEKYLILQKVERVKELLAYGELNLSEIAAELDYSSSAHLSAQFKKITGLTPTAFRQQGGRRRRGLDEIA